jgi:hypothetical protein
MVAIAILGSRLAILASRLAILECQLTLPAGASHQEIASRR